jgi:hypothetical protein
VQLRRLLVLPALLLLAACPQEVFLLTVENHTAFEVEMSQMTVEWGKAHVFVIAPGNRIRAPFGGDNHESCRPADPEDQFREAYAVGLDLKRSDGRSVHLDEHRLRAMVRPAGNGFVLTIEPGLFP